MKTVRRAPVARQAREEAPARSVPILELLLFAAVGLLLIQLVPGATDWFKSLLDTRRWNWWAIIAAHIVVIAALLLIRARQNR